MERHGENAGFSLIIGYSSAMSPSPLQILAELLRARITVEFMDERTFSHDWEAAIGLVPTHRLILILSGELEYEVEGKDRQLSARHMIFIPAWSRRGWRASGVACRFLWCEFSAEGLENLTDIPYVAIPADLRLETASLRRMWRVWQKPDEHRLRLEGELKAILARFWERVEPLWEEAAPGLAPAPHPEIAKALRWLRANYALPQAAAQLRARTTLSASHFRHLFQQAMHCTPGEYLLQLRLRRARYLLESSQLSVKEIAVAVGYEDPLYFSRRYKAFWGHPPTNSRRG